MTWLSLAHCPSAWWSQILHLVLLAFCKSQAQVSCVPSTLPTFGVCTSKVDMYGRNHNKNRWGCSSDTHTSLMLHRIPTSGLYIENMLSFSHIHLSTNGHKHSLSRRQQSELEGSQCCYWNSCVNTLVNELHQYRLQSLIKGLLRWGWYRVSKNSSFGMILSAIWIDLDNLCTLVIPSLGFKDISPAFLFSFFR